MMPQNERSKSPILDVTETLSLHSDMDLDVNPSYSLIPQQNRNMPAPALPPLGCFANLSSTLPAFEYIAPANHALQSLEFPLMELNRVGMFSSGFMQRRPRGEKRPIPDAQKDEKYYERRKRNNEAAKKSRDARKIREDRIAFRAALLEQENSILRAQVLALRDELETVRQLLGMSRQI